MGKAVNAAMDLRKKQCTTYSFPRFSRLGSHNEGGRGVSQALRYWRSILFSLCLTGCGAVLLIAAAVIVITPQNEEGPDALVLAIAGCCCILPGVYLAGYVYRSFNGYAGYRMEDMNY